MALNRPKLFFGHNWSLILLIAVGMLASSCRSKHVDDLTLFSLLPPEETGVGFTNHIENDPDMNIFKYRNFYNGGGVAIGDINNDGLADIYFTANMGPNRLYLNKGDLTFEDISEQAGVQGSKPWSTGVVMADVNSDGLLDIYVSNAGNLEGDNHDNDLYINNGDLTFTEQAEAFNLAKTGFSTHATFFDYDKDGDLDAYILNNSNIPVSSLGYTAHRHVRARDWEVPDIFKGVGDLLLRNDEGMFTDVSEEAGIFGSLIGFGLGVYVTDLNQDHYPDIYVSNDFYERDYLYINNQDGTFKEDIKNWTSHLCLSAMGVDMGDVNNDGLNDIFITDMLPETNQRTKSVMEFDSYNVFKLKQSKDFYQQYIQNTLQINNGNGSFSETAYFSGVAKTDWSWSGLIFDMDNDGFKDIYVTNGINHDLTDIDFVDFFANEVIQEMVLTGKKEEVTDIINKMPVMPLSNYAFQNSQDLIFANQTEDWGLNTPGFSNGCAYADLDNDGDLDLVVNNVNMPSFIFRNNSETVTKNNYLKIAFKGSEQNPFAIGTSVKLYLNDQVLFQELMPSRGFQSSMEYVMTIGLGEATRVDSIRILWPDDRTSFLEKVDVNQVLQLDQSTANSLETIAEPVLAPPIFKELSGDNYLTHQENPFNDFDIEGLISSQLSQEGPALAIADVDKDGDDDVFLGGAKGQAGVIYLQVEAGQLVPKVQGVFRQDAYFEDTAASFLDVDGDGDQDLMVGSGGNEPDDAKDYRPRLYLNDGQGQFQLSDLELPAMKVNISVIAPHDFNGDGKVDVFIGARSVPGIYGVNPSHVFLVNEGNGQLVDKTERYAYDLRHAGMVTDASWVDLDQDDIVDLVTVSEWGSPMFFKNDRRRLKRMKTSLDSLYGWWNTIEVADLDDDGDPDLVIGNKGSNVPYTGTKEHPMKLWINDFDINGGIEQITTIHEDGGDYPIHMRKELTAQIVSLKKENLKASDYSKRTIHELFSKEVIKETLVKLANTQESVIAINEGQGSFTISALPSRVQLSCVCGIVCADFNGDGAKDLLLAGNNFEFKPQYSQQDASYGNLLLGDGQLGFEWKNYTQSGFFVREEVKHLASFKDKYGRAYVFAAINDEKPRVFQYDPPNEPSVASSL